MFGKKGPEIDFIGGGVLENALLSVQFVVSRNHGSSRSG